jgi:hypothetical protein
MLDLIPSQEIRFIIKENAEGYINMYILYICYVQHNKGMRRHCYCFVAAAHLIEFLSFKHEKYCMPPLLISYSQSENYFKISAQLEY